MNSWKGKAFIKIQGELDSAYEDIYDVYGVCLRKGSYEKLLEYPSPKSLVIWSDRRNNGVEYLADSETMRVDKRNVSINVLLTASNEREYYERYESLFKKISSGIICLKIPTLGKVFKLVYNKQSNLSKINRNTSIFVLSFVEPNPSDRI